MVYHDFAVPHPSTGILVPIPNITLEEFKSLCSTTNDAKVTELKCQLMLTGPIEEIQSRQG